MKDLAVWTLATPTFHFHWITLCPLEETTSTPTVELAQVNNRQDTESSKESWCLRRVSSATIERAAALAPVGSAGIRGTFSDRRDASSTPKSGRVSTSKTLQQGRQVLSCLHEMRRPKDTVCLHICANRPVEIRSDAFRNSCSGTLPCAFCAQRGLECVFEERPITSRAHASPSKSPSQSSHTKSEQLPQSVSYRSQTVRPGHRTVMSISRPPITRTAAPDATSTSVVPVFVSPPLPERYVFYSSVHVHLES